MQKPLNQTQIIKIVPDSPVMNRNNRIGLIRKKASAANPKFMDGWINKTSNLKINRDNPSRNLFISRIK